MIRPAFQDTITNVKFYTWLVSKLYETGNFNYNTCAFETLSMHLIYLYIIPCTFSCHHICLVFNIIYHFHTSKMSLGNHHESVNYCYIECNHKKIPCSTLYTVFIDQCFVFKKLIALQININTPL